MLGAAIFGFITCLALIVAIGAQNLFVFRQGILRQYVAMVCAICVISDALLISAGVAFAETISRADKWVIDTFSYIAVAFLLIYGFACIRRSLRQEFSSPQEIPNERSRSAVALTCVAFTWLNPHVYIDTVGLMGAISLQFENLHDKLAYGFGAIFASLVFFLCIGFGAQYFSYFFTDVKRWAALEFSIGITMLLIASSLALNTAA